MSALVLPATSTEYVKVPIVATSAGAEVDPTSEPVELAFVPSGGTPEEADWKDGTWETEGSSREARCLVGPAGVVSLDPGDYSIWVRVTADFETPVLLVGAVTVL